IIIIINIYLLLLLLFYLSDHRNNCVKLIRESGLKTVFAYFMNAVISDAKHKKYKWDKKEIEEHTCVTIVQLFTHVSDEELLRLIQKFREKDFEKIDKLVELHVKYFNILEKNDQEESVLRKQVLLYITDIQIHIHIYIYIYIFIYVYILSLNHTTKNDLPEETPAERYARRLESGLYTLQMIDIIIGFLWTLRDVEISERLVQVLNRNDMDIDEVKMILTEYSQASNQIIDSEEQAQPESAPEANNSTKAPENEEVIDVDSVGLPEITQRLLTLFDEK
ncbi:armadillo-like helical domain-containing protein, partial [Reticulomyxa filosa]